MLRLWLGMLLAVVHVSRVSVGQAVFVEKVGVAQATTLDWKYAAGLPDDESANEGMARYASDQQQYDLYGPPRAPSRALPLILFVSPGNVPSEWTRFASTCQQHGVLFAGVRNAGNRKPFAQRIRATLDVLDDVRRRYQVDPDRTYIGGFSGGATIASRLAFTLPECFGGLLCIGQRVLPPRDDALVVRAGERVSVAALCGGRELVGPEVEQIDQPACQANGFRCRCFVSRRSAHRMPKPRTLENAFLWLEEAVPDRRTLGDRYTSTRLDARHAFDAATWRPALMEEAAARWDAQEYVAAVATWRWIESRWPESDEAAAAATTLAERIQRPEFVAADRQRLDERNLKLDEIYVAGYEKLAIEGQGKRSSKLRAWYGMKAINRINASPREIPERSQRVERLMKIVEQAKAPKALSR